MADPLVVKLANEFRQSLIDQQQSSVREMGRAWLQIEKAISEELAALAEDLAAIKEAGGTVTQAQVLRLERYRALQGQVLAQINRFTQLAAETIANDMAVNAQVGLDNAAALLQAIGQMNFARIRAEAIENIVAIARAGKPLAQLLQSVAPQAVSGMVRLLLEGVAIGRNPRDTADLAIRRGLSIGLNQALLIARDQQNRAYRQASVQQYRDSGLVDGYRRLAAKNDRTCPACLALDGTIYATNEMPQLHPQDRCTVIPIVAGLPPVEFETGAEWFDKQDAGSQRKILGPGRFEAWRDGKFELSDVAKVGNDPVWGPTLRVKTLGELTEN